MRLAIAVPEHHVSAPILDAGLEATTRLDESLIRQGAVPTFARALDAGRVRWRPEPPGDEHFDHAAIVLGRGWGDCDDLSPWHAASLRVTGEDPGARPFVAKSGPNRWHAMVRRSDGSVDDPNRAAGMPHKVPVAGVCGAVVAPMFRRPRPAGVSGPLRMTFEHGVSGPMCSPLNGPALRPAIAVRRVGEGWQGRVDLPWNETDYSLTALHKAALPSEALVGAIYGASVVGGMCGAASHDARRRLAAIAGLVSGSGPLSVHEVRGLANVVGAAAVRGAAGLLHQCGDIFNAW